MAATSLEEAESSNEEDFDSSSLGTKEHWDVVYAEELRHFQRRGLEGEIWFGPESNERIADYLFNVKKVEAKSSHVVDLGCGNAVTAICMTKLFSQVTAVDYSADAIHLAKGIAEKKGLGGKINFVVADLCDKKAFERSVFTLALDKGTYDAISLRPKDAKEMRKRYVDNVRHWLVDDGLLIITSCNWTQDELVNDLRGHFEHIHTIPTPTFSFGGKTGNLVTSLVFKNKASIQH